MQVVGRNALTVNRCGTEVSMVRPDAASEHTDFASCYFLLVPGNVSGALRPLNTHCKLASGYADDTGQCV